MVKEQFAPLVLSGEKCQTVRPTPKRMPKVGDRLILRRWLGKPYRSKQLTLREATITRIAAIKMNAAAVMVDGCVLLGDEEWAFARADGFNTPQDMTEWFNATHGLPFEGVVIYWSNAELSEAESARHSDQRFVRHSESPKNPNKTGQK